MRDSLYNKRPKIWGVIDIPKGIYKHKHLTKETKDKIRKAMLGNTHLLGCRITREVGDRKLKFGLANMRAIILHYKQSAKIRGIEWKLTEEQFGELTQKNCYYCGVKPNQIARSSRNRKSNGDYVYNGLDRVDNIKGYTIDNVVPCCKQCNTSKNNLTLQDFKNWVVRVYNKIQCEEGVEII